ncbi:MAG: leucine-rich repeat domain-containing protein, partial [Bacteroidales bacterium]|nr:leucine-rich repeat domain-containing protein [Bacteroidales bacterium]
ALENVSLPEGLISMGNCCFQYCSALRSITIPNSVTALSDDDNNGVDDGNLIGAAFMGCKGLKEVTIGASITNLAFANGLFNTNADPGELEKVTCYAATPPAIDGNTFLIGISSASLYVPEASIGTYIAAGYWSSFATNQQNSESWGAGIYPIPDPDACTPPDYFTVEMFTGKLIRSGGEEEEYNIIVSATELDTDGLANYSPENIIHTTENIYILSDSLTLQNETTYYVYLQKDCGAGKTSEWLSTLFYYYTGKICEWTVFGGDYYYSQDPANPSAGFGFGSDKVGLEFWQKNMLIARVMGDVSFLSPTITLIDGESVTIEWIGNANSGYNDENSIYVTDGDGNKIIDGITKYEQESATLGTFSVNCSGCASPTGFSENPINSNLTWAGNAVSYNIIVSKTALDSAGLADYAGTVYNITGANTFDLSDSITLEDKTMYYIYLQSDCGEGKTSEWVGASLLYETCPPPTSFTADKVSGYLTWISDVGAYNMIISNAELDENGLATYPGTVINTIDTCYDPSSALTTENTTYYFYLRSDCGEGKTSEWASTSFHYARFKEGDIYYRITASETVEVTYGGINPTAINEYTGEVTIPATVTHNLTTYSVTAVGANAFEGNTGLTSVTLPVSVTYLGTRAFAGCTALGAITLHEGLISMGSCCFQYCSALTSITIPNSVTALWDNNNDGVNDENDGATFMGCTGLKEVTVGAKITDVAAPNVLFNGVENIEKITCFATAPPASMWNGYFAFNWVTGSNCRLYVPEVSVGDYIIAAGWSRFATNQQNENSHGAGIYPIPPACASPTEFSANVINGNLTWTGNAALYNIIVSKTALDSAALADYADTVYDISANTSDLSDLVTLEDKTTYYIYLRSDCGEGETSEWVSTSFYNTADVKFFEVDGIYYRVTSNETVEVTFNGATPDSVQEYSGNITVPAQVEYNTERYNVTAVGAGAFQGNTGLDTVVLSAGITYLGANAFQGCSGLKNITLPEGLISMGSTCFQFDTSLTSIVIPNSVVALWDDNGDGVNDVSAAGGAFYGCTGLREVTVGSGINDISAPNVLFNGLVNLTKVTCLATAPPADSWNGYSAFNWVDFSNCALFVPAGSVNDYVNATGWWRFATTEQDPYSEAIGAGIYEVGTCVPPRNLTAEQLSGYLTWTGYAYTEGYNIIVSATELDSAALAAYPAGNIVKTSETEYDPSALTLESEATYYVYVQGDCGSGGTGKWVSASFYYYTDSTCEWTVFGGDYWQATPSSPNYGFGYDNNSVGLEFWQRDILIAEVKGQVSLDHPTVTLIDGESVTIEWIGTGIYEDDNSIYVTDGSGTPIINGVIKKDNASERLGTFDVSCTGGIVTDIEKPATTKIIVVPTLSNGFVTVSGAEAGSTVKVVDSRGRVLKSETVAGDRRIELNYTNGLYFIVVRSGNRVVTEKVILKR